MEHDAKTENALGVAYLRLRKFDDAERHLKAAKSNVKFMLGEYLDNSELIAVYGDETE